MPKGSSFHDMILSPSTFSYIFFSQHDQASSPERLLGKGEHLIMKCKSIRLYICILNGGGLAMLAEVFFPRFPALLKSTLTNWFPVFITQSGSRVALIVEL